MGYANFVQISFERNDYPAAVQTQVDSIYKEMIGSNADYPDGAYIWFKAYQTPEEYFAPFVKQLNALGIFPTITVYEPREIELPEAE